MRCNPLVVDTYATTLPVELGGLVLIKEVATKERRDGILALHNLETHIDLPLPSNTDAEMNITDGLLLAIVEGRQLLGPGHQLPLQSERNQRCDVHHRGTHTRIEKRITIEPLHADIHTNRVLRNRTLVIVLSHNTPNRARTMAITHGTIAATHAVPPLATTLAVLIDTVNGDVACPIANKASRAGPLVIPRGSTVTSTTIRTATIAITIATTTVATRFKNTIDLATRSIITVVVRRGGGRGRRK